MVDSPTRRAGILVVFLTLLVAGTPTENEAQAPAPPAAGDRIALPSPANPFLRSWREPKSESCVAMNLEAPGGSFPAKMVIENQCGHAVAVLTTPLEVRLRLSGLEPLVNERMASGAAYAILYVGPADLREKAFRGDGVVRDGGLQVKRPPGYTTVPAKGRVEVPVLCEDIDAPPGRYFLPLWTFEAPQGEAPIRTDPFDCRKSVARHNAESGGTIDLRLGGDARQVSGRSVAVELKGSGS